jgi:hypothetical protein
MQNHSSFLFKIVAQNRGDELVIEIVDRGLFMIRKARDILKDSTLLQGFSQEDASKIGLAAGMEIGK